MLFSMIRHWRIYSDPNRPSWPHQTAGTAETSMAARPKQTASRRRSREEEAPPRAPPPRARGQPERAPMRNKVLAHSESDEDRDQGADEDEEEDAEDAFQAGPPGMSLQL